MAKRNWQDELARKDAEIERLRVALAQRQKPEGERLEGVVSWLCEDEDRMNMAAALMGAYREKLRADNWADREDNRRPRPERQMREALRLVDDNERLRSVIRSWADTFEKAGMPLTAKAMRDEATK